MKEKNWFERLAGGVGLGITSMIPGLSAAIMAVILRISESISKACTDFKNHVGKSISTLLPIIIGAVIGLIGSLVVFKWALVKCLFFFICIFAGFLIGNLPGYIKEIKGSAPSFWNILCSIIGAIIPVAFGLVFMKLEKNGVDFSTYFDELFTNYWILFVLFGFGIISSCAIRIPGFSGTLIVFVSGFYTQFMNYFTKWGKQLFKGNFDNIGCLLVMIFAFVIGFFVGAIFVSKYTKKAYDNHKISGIYAIIGFSIGGFVSLFINNQVWQCYKYWAGSGSSYSPTMTADKEIPLGILFLGIMAFFSFMVYRAKNNLLNKEDNN